MTQGVKRWRGFVGGSRGSCDT
uniref:Uncharacterized protein n=1 Tax=Vitis vinifera TaxID=29760 RepID=F6GTT5_VITVI